MNMDHKSASPRGDTVPSWVVWVLCLMILVAGLGGAILGSVAFPRDRMVDRPVEVVIEKEVPVEKIVEKPVDRPVEVVKVVEKQVPAPLTPAQQSAIEFATKAFDVNSVTLGPTLVKLSDKVMVKLFLEGDGASRFSHSEVRTAVENAFRRQGFKVLAVGSKEYPYTVVNVSGVYLENRGYGGQILGVSGSYDLSLRQPIIYFTGHNLTNIADARFYVGEVPLHSDSGTLNYGSNNYWKIPDVYGRMADTAASELRKALESK